MTQTLVHDLLIILAAGLLAAMVCRWLKTSVLIGYLLVGALLGQGVLGWVLDENHQLEHFAEIGVFLLLFSIGLEFSISDLKRLGRHFVIGGAAQMLLVIVPVCGILLYWQMDWPAGNRNSVVPGRGIGPHFIAGPGSDRRRRRGRALAIYRDGDGIGLFCRGNYRSALVVGTMGHPLVRWIPQPRNGHPVHHRFLGWCDARCVSVGSSASDPSVRGRANLQRQSLDKTD